MKCGFPKGRHLYIQSNLVSIFELYKVELRTTWIHGYTHAKWIEYNSPLQVISYLALKTWQSLVVGICFPRIGECNVQSVFA